MYFTDERAAENALFYDIFYSGTTRDWDELSAAAGLGDRILGWFCQRVLSDDALFPEKPEDKADILFRTYALGAVLAGYTAPERIEEIISEARSSIASIYGGSGSDSLILERRDAVCTYELTFMDSAKGCGDAIAAMALAYMYMSGIPRDNEHARRLIETCYAWMYAYSKYCGAKKK